LFISYTTVIIETNCILTFGLN